jgi:hypothetical protein
MGVTVSGLYVANFIDVLDASQLAVDLSLTTHKIALLSNAATPNFSTDASWSSTNEVSGTGWPTGGVALSAAAAGATSTAPTTTESPTGSLMYDMNDIAVSATTLTNARAARIYADALTTPTADALIVLINFAVDFSTNNGTFGIQWASTGVFALDLTP